MGSRLENVERLIARIRSHIQRKNFLEAVKLYEFLDQQFLTLDKNKQERLKGRMEIVYKEIVTYLRINEAYLYAEKGELESLKSEIARIHDLAYDLSTERESADVVTLLEYVDRHYKFFLDVYSYKITIKGFNKLHEQTREAFEEKNFKVGLKRFAELLIAYNTLAEIVDSEKRIELYHKVKILFRDLAIQRLFHFASEKPGRIPFKLRLPNVKPAFRSANLPKAATFDKRYEELRDLLAQNDEEKASKIYAGLDRRVFEKEKSSKKKVQSKEFKYLRSLIKMNKAEHAERLYKKLE